MAGKNKNELEKTLNYYLLITPDSLKYKAACFLIENMLGHYSYKDTLVIANYYNEIDSIAELSDRDSLYEIISNKYNGISLQAKPDVECISSQYLIDNIENSFKLWRNNEWTRQLDFNDFCEYILPYKTMRYQILDNWKVYFSEYAKNIWIICN